jgi:hypothetical protein
MIVRLILMSLLAFGLLTTTAQAATPPPNCKVWYDGCNTCANNNGILRCTTRACVRKGEAVCRKWAVPNWCAAWFDGCNSCIRSVRGGTICTQRACAKLKAFRCFQRVVMPSGCQRYFDGCTTCQRVGGMVRCAVRTCTVRKAARCLTASSGGRPANCIRWFDGCNVCRRTSGGWACTRRACAPAQRRPARCLATR